MVPDADYRIKLPVFEGPLDLLLFLIKKNEIDIYDIPIVSVTRQYIDVLHSMQQLDLEIAGEFFVMAATLMEIKSRMLLPRGQAAIDPNATEEEMDPRWELVHQLLQYKKFKEAAAKLDELAVFQRDLLARHVSDLAVPESDRPLKNVDRIELWNAFNIVLRRLAEKLVVGEIKDEQVTVADKMEEVLAFIQTRKTFVFTELFGDQQVTVRLLVATFIAVLELTRLGKLRVRQNDAFTDIECSARDDTPPSPSPPLDSPSPSPSLQPTTSEPAQNNADGSAPDHEAPDQPSQTLDASIDLGATSPAQETITANALSSAEDTTRNDPILSTDNTTDISAAAPQPDLVAADPATPEPKPEKPLETPPEASTVTA